MSFTHAHTHAHVHTHARTHIRPHVRTPIKPNNTLPISRVSNVVIIVKPRRRQLSSILVNTGCGHAQGRATHSSPQNSPRLSAPQLPNDTLRTITESGAHWPNYACVASEVNYALTTGQLLSVVAEMGVSLLHLSPLTLPRRNACQPRCPLRLRPRLITRMIMGHIISVMTFHAPPQQRCCRLLFKTSGQKYSRSTEPLEKTPR